MGKSLRPFIFILSLLWVQSGAAVVRVAFIELRTQGGLPVRLGPGERFYHVAVQVEGLWYQSSPHKLVEPSKKLILTRGMLLSEVLEHEDLKIKSEDVEPFLGQKFDYTFNWLSEVSTYCTKFVVELLNSGTSLKIRPSAMGFRGRHWRFAKDLKRQRKGRLGLSPDELYKALVQNDFFTVYSLGEGGFKGKQAVASESPSCQSFL